jgi:hypothetical protein
MRTRSLVRQGVAATVVFVLTSAAITSLTSNPAYANLCPLTQGFWKNHPNAWDGVTSLMIGGQTYDQADLITILKTPPKGGDASLILAHQLIAAKLNVDTGSVFIPDPIGSTIAMADMLLSTNCGTSLLPSCFVAASSTPGQQMVNAAATLDAFNSGTLTPICTPR